MRQAALTLVVLISICLCPSLPPALGADEAQPDRFTNVIQPILQQNCYACHNAQENKGELDLARLTSGEKLAANADLLQSMLEIVSAGFMPPQKATRQPSAKIHFQKVVSPFTKVFTNFGVVLPITSKIDLLVAFRGTLTVDPTTQFC
ncbi:MAG: hypothetical protein P8N76_25900 [Pirellulaceae bacterium]|nr:hypothetical protein [Pirellulaceae bacterium]